MQACISKGLQTFCVVAAGIAASSASAQAADAFLTPREQRELGREFRMSVAAIELFRTRTAAAPDSLQFSGSIGVSLTKASDGSSGASLPAEIDILHPRSGITPVLANDLHVWAHDDTGTVHDGGAFAATAVRKWKLNDVTSFAVRASAVLDSGSAVSDPSTQAIALVLGRKISDAMSVSVAGSAARGPAPSLPGVSRYVSALSVRLNHGFGSEREHTMWGKFSSSHRSGSPSRQAAALGIDYALVPDV